MSVVLSYIDFEVENSVSAASDDYPSAGNFDPSKLQIYTRFQLMKDMPFGESVLRENESMPDPAGNYDIAAAFPVKNQ